MFSVLKTSFKNILRNKRRTLLMELLIVFGVVVILFATAFLKSMSDNWRDAIVGADLGEVQVMQKGYKDRMSSLPLDKNIPHADQIVEAIQHTAGIAAVTKRISFGGLASSADETAPFFARGVDVDQVISVLPKLYGTLASGTALQKDQENGALLGDGLAKLLNVKVGDTVLLTAYDRFKAMNAVEVVVLGTLRIPEEVANDRMLLTSFQTAAILLGFDHEATEIILKTTDFSRLTSVKGSLEKQFATKHNLEFFSWSALAGSFNQASGMFALVSLVIGIIIYVVVLVALINTILTHVFERTNEIGMQMALGSSRRRIMFGFVSEAVFLGIAGLITGVLLHKGILLFLADSGIAVPPPPGAIDKIILYPRFSWMHVTNVFVAMCFVTFLASLYPAWFASKLSPADTMRAP